MKTNHLNWEEIERENDLQLTLFASNQLSTLTFEKAGKMGTRKWNLEKALINAKVFE